MDNQERCIRFLMGEATAQEVEALNAWIAESPEHAKQFALLAAQDAAMASAVGNLCAPAGGPQNLLADLAALEASAGPAQPVDRTEEFARRKREEKQRTFRIRRARAEQLASSQAQVSREFVIPKLVVWLGLAAVLGIAVTVAFQLNRHTPQSTSSPVVEHDPEPTRHRSPHVAAVADLTQSFDAAWLAAKPTHTGEFLPGTYTLTRGWAEVETAQGVAVVLEAPVTFELSSNNAITLSQGQLVADVPERAHGFTVWTPGGRVIDYGTTFGVAVDDAGSTMAHVFRGEVEVKSTDTTAPTVRLNRDEAASVRTGGAVTRVSAQPELFAREVPATAYQAAVMKSRPMCYWRGPVDEETRQVADYGWLGADGQTTVTLRHRRAGFVDEDPSGSLDFRSSAMAAAMIGPHDQLVLTSSFTVEAWCWIEPGHEGFMRIVSTRSENGGFGFGVNGQSENDSIGNWPRNAPVFTFFREADFIGDVVLPEAQWVHLAVVVDPGGRVSMFVDGSPVRVHKTVHPNSVAQQPAQAALMIGRNPFVGRGIQGWQGLLDEVAIYDRALSPDEINEHHNALLGP